jgi:hypothetical protein
VRKRLLMLAGVVALGVAILAWFAVEDAWQEATLDARIRDAGSRVVQAEGREQQLRRDGAPAEELRRAARESEEAWEEAFAVDRDRRRRKEFWYGQLRREIRRRTGW